ncbi:kynureninase [Corallococcus carmarthensis]|uniref:Kynureninase n=1 Tax=Corallococcus carmarthensis TaxID=2316728 RepID=A0A3A8KHB5_9BACT|nr:kynureninase [Corallococcus carmarthensis]NOK16877.1 kynureninase [Corallococcus carmarthensis]RKH06936.1 kynureninase [Corallococcus carmarthensis]
MTAPVYENTDVFAYGLDAKDPLRPLRDEFLFPPAASGAPTIYLAGNSLGLQPRKARKYVQMEMEDWERLGVEGHMHGRHPWLPYHELLTEQVARVVGAQPLEVVVMNTLSVNLHLMMVSFYRPTPERFKILIEGGAFPSDQYAVASQARFHGYDPKEAIVRLMPREGEDTLRSEDILEAIERHGKEVALVMLGSVNYLTGQAFDLREITRVAHAQGCKVGFDLAHGAGNLKLSLHDDGPDFAVWCSYKYLNGGPGSLGGVFVHERHARSPELPRFEGWWGHNKATRFEMGPTFDPLPGAEGWQLSNPPIFQLAALRSSLELFDKATMAALRAKSDQLTGFLEFLLDRLPAGYVTITTPRDLKQRGAQLSLRFKGEPKRLLHRLSSAGIICDFREPDIIRAAPAPLYNTYLDVFRFVKALEAHALE